MKKKIIASLAVAMTMVTLLSTSVFAHGHHGNSKGLPSNTYTLCTVRGCNTTGTHKHGNTYYSGHNLNDGHNYHQVCSVYGCTKTTMHEHNGVTCFPHSNTDGHRYHSSEHWSKGRHH